MKTMGWLLMGSGVGLLVTAFFFNVAVPNPSYGALGVGDPEMIANNDLMSIRALMAQAATALMVTGAVLFSAAKIVAALPAARPIAAPAED